MTPILSASHVTKTFAAGRGPVDVRVVDPLRVPAADFDLRVAPDDADLEDAVEAFWTLTNLTMLEDDDPTNDLQAVHTSSRSIAVQNEELLLDWGISVTIAGVIGLVRLLPQVRAWIDDKPAKSPAEQSAG